MSEGYKRSGSRGGSGGGGGSSVGPVSTYVASGSDDSAGILSAFNALKVSGHAHGSIKLKGQIQLNSQLVLDGGFTDVCNDANLVTADTGQRFRLDTTGASIAVGSGVGQAIVAKGFYEPELNVLFAGGGNLVNLSDAGMTSGSNILASAGTNMTGWLGYVVVVVGADAKSGYLVSVVDSVTDSHHVVLRRQATATVSGAVAQGMPAGLHIENIMGGIISAKGSNFGGCILHGDCTGDTTKRVRRSSFPELWGDQSSMTSSLTSFEAGLTFVHIWANQSANTVPNSGIIGTHWCALDDISVIKYEGGGAATGLAERVNMLWEGCSSGNHGFWSVGDRDSDCMIKIVGNMTINGSTTPSNFGSVAKIRASGYMPGSDPTIIGVRMIEVDSIEIGDLNTFRLLKGVHIIGSNARIKRHHSLTADGVPITIETTAYNTAPYVDIGGHWKFFRNQLMLVNPSSGGWATQAAATGGYVRLRGYCDTPNQSAGGSVYAIDVQGTTSPIVVDLSDYYQLTRATLAGSVKHTAPDNIRGITRSRLGNVAGVTQGAAPALVSKPGSGTAVQNTTDRTLNLYLAIRHNPAASGTAESELFLGAVPGGAVVHVADNIVTAPASAALDITLQNTVRVPPGWTWQYNLTGACTVSNIWGWYE